MQTFKEYQPTGWDCKGLGSEGQENWFVLPTGQNRDSDCLDRSNFDCAVDILGGESDNVVIHRFNHWACGWLEIIVVKPGTPEHETAKKIETDLADYPVLDDNHYYNLEHTEATEVWRDCYNDKDRLEYVKSNRDQFEFNNYADLMNCVRGDYFAGDASELLS